MANLFSTIGTAADAMSVFEQALEVTQNNVNNASLATYARQRLPLQSLSFAPGAGLPGGVSAAAVESARNQYADAEVRGQLQRQGSAEELAAGLSRIAGRFDATGASGLPAALNQLLQSFSQWSADPNSQAARSTVLNAAGGLARSFQQSVAALETERTQTGQQIGATVAAVNEIASRIRGYNAQRLRSGPDAGLDANLQAALEQLSELSDITATTQPDGTVTVLLGGQTPLVAGASQYDLSVGTAPAGPSAAYPGGVPQAAILDGAGRDVTEQAAGGKLGALLEIRNRVLPSLIGGQDEAGDLNRLAAGFAGRVNRLLTSGMVSDGQYGQPLFVYDTSNPVNAARTLAVAPGMTAGGLAAIDPGPPYAANGVALKLAQVGDPATPENTIDGQSFMACYGTIASRVGSRLSEANTGLNSARDAAAQARSLREQISGVSLDEEAVYLLQFQRAYQATARMISVLNDLTQTTLDLLR